MYNHKYFILQITEIKHSIKKKYQGCNQRCTVTPNTLFMTISNTMHKVLHFNLKPSPVVNNFELLKGMLLNIYYLRKNGTIK